MANTPANLRTVSILISVRLKPAYKFRSTNHETQNLKAFLIYGLKNRIKYLTHPAFSKAQPFFFTKVFWWADLPEKILAGVKSICFVLTVLTYVVFCGLCAIAIDLSIYANNPTGRKDTGQSILVKPGQGFGVTAENLERAGVIINPFKFKLLARLTGKDKQVKAGEYLIPDLLSPSAVLDILVGGKVVLHRLTVPEGYTIRQIASAVAAAGFGTEEAFLHAAIDANAAREMGIEAETFEGYLFPDTYYLSREKTPEKIITVMVKRFWSVFKPQWNARVRELGFSIHQIVTLASIIEKETGDPSERPVISSVFHNRLKKRMRLESDPTVIYGIDNFGGNLTRKDLATYTPYNTYRIQGLPPGPIANPGLQSLEAALYPADTRYLYFVSKRDGTHQFSTNNADHNRAVRKYQLRK